jgi:hypothetical protein
MSPETRKHKASFICMMLTACVLSAQVSAAETAMKSIDDYLASENTGPRREKNPAHGQFVGLRCAAIFGIMAQFSNENGKNKTGDVFDVAQDNALKLAMESSNPFNESFFVSQLKIMKPAYIERMQKAKALTGNLFSDPLVSSDFDTCTEIFRSKK